MNPILHSSIKGSGKPLMVLHGVFGMSDNWSSFGTVFSDYFEVHLIDLRNHGRSFHTDDFNYELMVEDMYQYIQHHQLTEIHLLGHSMGGKVALFFTQKYEHLVSKLIIVDIAPKFYPIHHQQIIDALTSVDFDFVISRKQTDEILSKSIKEEGVKQFLLKNLYWKTPNQLAFRVNVKSIAQNIHHLGTEVIFSQPIKIQTLFIKGAQSNYMLQEDFESIQDHFEQVQIQSIKNAGHWVHAENPADFNQAVLNFLLLNNHL